MFKKIILVLSLGLLLSSCNNQSQRSCNHKTKMFEETWGELRYVICDGSLTWQRGLYFGWTTITWYDYNKLEVKETDNFKVVRWTLLYTDKDLYYRWQKVNNIKSPIINIFSTWLETTGFGPFYIQDQEWIKYLKWTSYKAELVTNDVNNFTYINQDFVFDSKNIYLEWKVWSWNRQKLHVENNKYIDDQYLYSNSGVTILVSPGYSDQNNNTFQYVYPQKDFYIINQNNNGKVAVDSKALYMWTSINNSHTPQSSYRLWIESMEFNTKSIKTHFEEQDNTNIKSYQWVIDNKIFLNKWTLDILIQWKKLKSDLIEEFHRIQENHYVYRNNANKVFYIRLVPRVNSFKEESEPLYQLEEFEYHLEWKPITWTIENWTVYINNIGYAETSQTRSQGSIRLTPQQKVEKEIDDLDSSVMDDDMKERVKKSLRENSL